MKFGTQLKSKSVPEWRSYNIDYNDLKRRIRITTEGKTANSAFIKDLHNAFIEQIDMVNLFLLSKVGEVKRRIVYVENMVEQLESQDNTDQEYTENKIDEELERNLGALSSDLQKLSRFIVLQKTGLRKLLKKYTKWSGDGGQLNSAINKYLIKNTNSFIYIDLTGFYLELALIYDLLRAKQAPSAGLPGSANTTPTRNRRASYADPVQNLRMNEIFDFESIKNGASKELFLVHYDNITELKLFLLAHFYCIDETVRLERKTLQVQRKKSSISFRELIKRLASSDDVAKKQDDQTVDAGSDHGDDNDERSRDIYRSNSIYLNDSDDLANLGEMTLLYLDDPKHLQSISNEADPGMFLTDSLHDDRTLLISAIGGLRKASNVVLHDDSFIIDLLKSASADEKYESFASRHSSFISELDSLEKISIEWIFSGHIKPLVKAKCNRTRFAVSRLHDKAKFQCWITLSSNIKFSSTNLTSATWSAENESSATSFPYATLEVRYNRGSNTTKSPPELLKLMESHLIYKIDSTLNALTYDLYCSKSLSFEPSWAKFFGDSPLDIRKNPPKAPRRPKSSLKSSNRAQSAISLSGVSDSSLDKQQGSVSESSQFRYWNEFDNGSEGEDNAAFFVDVDDGDDNFFSPATMEYFYKISNSIVTFIHDTLPSFFDHEDSENLLNSRTATYGSTPLVNASGSGVRARSADSDVESLGGHEDSRYAADVFRSFLALALSTFGIVLVALALGVSASLLQFGEAYVNPIVILLLVVGFFSSLSMSVVSVGLIMAVDDEHRRVWQTAYVWLSFFIITILTVMGTVSLFGL